MRVLVANFVRKPDKNLEEGRRAKGGIAEAMLSRCGDLGDSSTMPHQLAMRRGRLSAKTACHNFVGIRMQTAAMLGRRVRTGVMRFGRDDRKSALKKHAVV